MNAREENCVSKHNETQILVEGDEQKPAPVHFEGQCTNNTPCLVTSDTTPSAINQYGNLILGWIPELLQRVAAVGTYLLDSQFLMLTLIIIAITIIIIDLVKGWSNSNM